MGRGLYYQATEGKRYQLTTLQKKARTGGTGKASCSIRGHLQERKGGPSDAGKEQAFWGEKRGSRGLPYLGVRTLGVRLILEEGELFPWRVNRRKNHPLLEGGEVHGI